MKKRLAQWVEERAHIKITLNYHRPNSALPETMVGFLLDFDEIGLTISRSHSQKMWVLIPWNNVLDVQLWGAN